MPPQLPEAMIRDTVAAVFSDPAYQRSTLWQRIGWWLLDQLRAFVTWLDPDAVPESVFWILLTLFAVVLLSVLLRWLYGHRRWPGWRRAPRSDEEAAAGLNGDAWVLARRLAAHGDYTAAAHALYAGILQSIARRGELTLHESKTIGDYVRELSARSSGVLSRFREFSGSYEVVIYGLGTCDRDRYERLLGMASLIADHHG